MRWYVLVGAACAVTAGWVAYDSLLCGSLKRDLERGFPRPRSTA